MFILGLIMLVLIVNLFIQQAYEENYMKKNYTKLTLNKKTTISLEEYKNFNKNFCDSLNFSVTSYEVKYIDKKIAFLKIKSNYFSFDGTTLKFIFCSKCLIEEEINKYVKEIAYV